VALLAACGGDDAAGNIDARALLDRSATRMDALQSFHFVLEFEGGAAEIVRGLQMQRAEGDYGGPENLQTQVLAKAGPINANVEMRVVQGQSWMTNPLNGRWEQQSISVGNLFNVSTGATALMRQAQDPKVTGRDTIDGTSVHRVEATLPSDQLTLLPNVVPGKTLRATAWIGEADPVVHRLEVSGQIFAPNVESKVRLNLSRFDVPVVVEAPR
jgi:hypothetical protein